MGKIMSRSEIERFKRDLRANPALTEEATKHRTLAATVRFAAGRGYRFTPDEATAHAKARAAAAGRELSDAELDAAAGAGIRV
jgi:predicted ribosomally synthesized peptide with nif11-like leader